MSSETSEPPIGELADKFARRRLTVRAVTVMVVQGITAVAAGSQLFVTLEWNHELKGNLSTRLGCDIEASIEKDTENVCCLPSAEFETRLKNALSILKTEGTMPFITTISLSLVAFVVTLFNFLKFIKLSQKPYVRKTVLNVVTFLAFLCQVTCTSTFYEGVDCRIRSSQKYCTSDEKKLPNGLFELSYCLQKAGGCPVEGILYGSWAVLVLSTICILLITGYTCKCHQRVYKTLEEELNFRRKPVLHSLQRLMIRNIKQELQCGMEVERVTVHELQHQLREMRAFITSVRRFCDRNNVEIEEVPSYYLALREYERLVTELLDKSEILNNLRQLDLDILRDFVRYTSLEQKIPLSTLLHEEKVG